MPINGKSFSLGISWTNCFVVARAISIVICLTTNVALITNKHIVTSRVYKC